MEVLHLRCAGLDVHQKTIMACARIASANGVSHHVQVFGTTTRDLLALADWLASHGCTHVAMESTSAQWLKTTLVQAAWAAVRTKDSYLRAQVRRLKSRRGPKKAIIAVAASMLRAIYFMLQRGSPTATSAAAPSIAATWRESPAGSWIASVTSASRWRSGQLPNPSISF